MSWYSEEDEKLQNAIDSIKDDLYFILECVKMCEESEDSEWSTRSLKEIKRTITQFIEDHCN